MVIRNAGARPRRVARPPARRAQSGERGLLGRVRRGAASPVQPGAAPPALPLPSPSLNTSNTLPLPGHMVPHDRPEVSQAMIEGWLESTRGGDDRMAAAAAAAAAAGKAEAGAAAGKAETDAGGAAAAAAPARGWRPARREGAGAVAAA